VESIVPSGCGKTTTTRLIAGLEKPDAQSGLFSTRTNVERISLVTKPTEDNYRWCYARLGRGLVANRPNCAKEIIELTTFPLRRGISSVFSGAFSFYLVFFGLKRHNDIGRYSPPNFRSEYFCNNAVCAELLRDHEITCWCAKGRVDARHPPHVPSQSPEWGLTRPIMNPTLSRFILNRTES